MDDFIEIIPDVISAENCSKIVQALENKLTFVEKYEGAIIRDDSESRKDISIFPRNFGSLNFAIELVEEALINNPSKYKKDNNKYLFSNWKFQKSSAGGGFYDWHTEQGKSENIDVTSRFMVWMIYLNTVEKGGKTEFKYQKKAVKPEAGTLVLWPAGYSHVHRAAPDLEEDKYIATGWFVFS